ncbi:MAG TPA: PH domain-containing protein [Bryobacteraceae bacterium]|nr:PH domain-containing protein [Bryobacteraceae bacterium]
MTHKAKIDWWILAALTVGIVAPLLSGKLWITAPLFLAVGICGYPQWYETSEEGLVVRAGLLRRVIPYQAITFVGPCGQEPAGSPCRHVQVRYGNYAGITIFPANYDAFLDDMATRCRSLSRRGEALAPQFA